MPHPNLRVVLFPSLDVDLVACAEAQSLVVVDLPWRQAKGMIL